MSLVDATVGLEAARLWLHLRWTVSTLWPLDTALEAGYLLDAEAVGRALALLRRVAFVSGDADGFVALNSVVPF